MVKYLRCLKIILPKVNIFLLNKICNPNTSSVERIISEDAVFLLLKSDKELWGLRCSDLRCPVRLQMSPDKTVNV